MTERKFCILVILAVSFLVVSLAAAEGVQRVEVADFARGSAPGTFSFAVKYSAPPALSGLGLRLHYDSSAIRFDRFDQLLESGLIARSEPTADIEDFDGDQRTDMYVLVAWADLYGSWPGSSNADLFRISFRSPVNDLAGTPINFTASSTAAGYTLAAPPVEIGSPSPPTRHRKAPSRERIQ